MKGGGNSSSPSAIPEATTNDFFLQLLSPGATNERQPSHASLPLGEFHPPDILLLELVPVV
jgi:hypothetical protein